MHNSYRCIARGSPLLSSFPDPAFERVVARSNVVGRARGETVFLQNDPAAYVFVVLEGWVKLYRATPSGAEAVVHVFTRGGSFAEAVALRGSVYPVSAEAVTDAVLLEVPSAEVLAMMRAEPEVAIAILASTLVHLRSLVGQIEQLKARTGAQRVAEFLLGLCPVPEGACTVTLPHDKTLIAARLGMAPESLSRAWTRLADVGVTVRREHADVADVERLAQFVGQDRSGSRR